MIDGEGGRGWMEVRGAKSQQPTATGKGKNRLRTYHESNLFIEDRTHLPVLAATNDEGDGRSRMSQ